MIDVHASGGRTLMRAARDAADQEAARMSRPAPLVIAVTILTSLSPETTAEIGIAGSLVEQVARLAVLAQSCGQDGVVASPREIAVTRARCGDRLAVVTPGIRSPSDANADQRRTLTASQALAAGASHLVVGRPIIAAPDPRAAAERIIAECSSRS